MNGEWKVRLAEYPGRLGLDLFIFRRTYGDMEYLIGDKVETVERGMAIPPTLHLEQEMLIGLAEQLFTRGIKPADAGKTEGLYEAQSAHLDDLRHLLKLPKTPIIIEKRSLDL